MMPLAVGRVRVFRGVDVHTDAIPHGTARESRINALKASFHAINTEDKPITAAIARNAHARAAAPGRLLPKANTLLDFQRYLVRIISDSEQTRG